MSQALSDLAVALERRAETAPDPGRVERAETLRRHVADYLIPRASDLSAPLVVVIMGSTGVGRRIGREAAARVRESVAQAVATAGFAGLDRVEDARRRLASLASGSPASSHQGEVSALRQER